jgi:polyhydroxyalkanoate synthesis repressor PhaR
MVVIKKYSNRRLYDTRKSGYITLEELAESIREGTDVKVVDAKTGEDLTQPTLAQIILDSRGAAKLLPVELLTQLIRMRDEALTEFLGKYVSWALEMYLSARRGAQAVAPYFPFATLPFNATNAMARMMSGVWGGGPEPPPVTPERPMVDADPAPGDKSPSARSSDEIADLRRELEELKQAMRGKA